MSGNGGHTPWTITSGVGYAAAAPLEQFVLIRPKRGATGRLILWHHGTGGETVFVLPAWKTAATPSTANVRTNLHEKILTPLVDAGYSILACDFGGKETFGNASNMARISDALTFVATLGLNTAKVGLLGESMGSASIFQWAATHAAQVAVIVGYLQVGDWDDVYDNVTGMAAKLDAAYPGGWAANTAAHNPVAPAVREAVKDAGLAPHWRGYYASDDPLASPIKARALASLLGVPLSAVNLGPGGHTDTPLAAVDPVELVRFVNAGAWQ